MCGHETILLVDDEQVIREVTGDLLTTLGYKVLLARSGEEAVNIFKEQHHDIMVVILDIIMPDMGGGAVFDKIKSLHPNAKIILSSGCSLNDSAKAIMRWGCRSFLQKPYRLEELSGTIRHLIDEQ